MRKKLLRSRSGFEKPESREEAIMQNILGASNVLEPSESNIEEILKSILYNTPYTKEAEFEIEKILLAIKNNGTYDGEVESRDMKILLAILRESNYTEETESRIEELYVEWLQQRSQIKVLEGVPPLTYTARGLPLINYLIEGNTVQSGTPTPDSPVMPQGTGERTGNLFDKDNYNIVYGYFIVGETTTITAESSNNIVYIPCKPNTTYTVSKILSKRFGIGYTIDKPATGVTVYGAVIEYTATSLTVTTDSSAKYLVGYIRNGNVAGESSLSNIVNSLQITESSTPLPYEPFGIKIPILNNSQTTNVYLGEVQTTRKIKKLVLTGTEPGWTKASSANVYYLTDAYNALNTANIISCMCSHYEAQINVSTVSNVANLKCCFRITLQTLYIHDNTFTSNTDFVTFLQQQYANGTPVTVWYVLANEETGIVNEPLHKIGDYADTLSMEQAGIEIPTINGSNTFDVDTTVKPSNVYIEYK